ncbi:MAG TPA: choice-of-anchor L domain-containing protein [Bacteroidales bacterium]|nr:choice-of-anchor L domain-containing protein [Bacteroidales bacterium]
MRKFFLLIPAFLFVASAIYGQLVVTPSNDPTALVNSFIQSGVTVSNVQYTGDTNALGGFSGGNSTNLGINSGIVLTTGDLTVPPFIGSQASNFSNSANNALGDSLLNTLIPGYLTYDASILEFDLVPAGNILLFEYVFASEEYPEYVNSSFNDVFGFFITGLNPAGGLYANTNVALVPGTSMPVAINNINLMLNNAYYVYNVGGVTIVFDGFTTVLTATIPVVPLATYHLKMAIADAGDMIFDSGIFLQCPSMRSYTITGTGDHNAANGSVYPNPINQASGLNLNLTQAGNVVVTVYDFAGKHLGQKAFNGLTGSNVFPIGDILGDYPSGFYFFGIQTPDGYFVEKLMK